MFDLKSTDYIPCVRAIKRSLQRSLNNCKKPGNPCKYWGSGLLFCLSVPEVYHIPKL